jgi:hypothetical protein
MNSALFSNMDAVVLHPLAVPRLDRVVTVGQQDDRNPSTVGYTPVTLADYEDWVRQSHSFESLAVRKEEDRTLTGTGDATHLEAAVTSANFFPVLRATPLMGRVYSESETKPGQDAEAVLSYGLWQRQFAADASVLGRTIELDQRKYTIVGVMPKTMQYPSLADVYLPFTPAAEQLSNRKAHNYLDGCRTASP